MAETRTVTLATGAKIALRTWGYDRYRLTLNETEFGQIKHEGREWAAEVRKTETGAIVRYAGRWETLRDAVAELVDISNGLPLSLSFRRLRDSTHGGPSFE